MTPTEEAWRDRFELAQGALAMIQRLDRALMKRNVEMGTVAQPRGDAP